MSDDLTNICQWLARQSGDQVKYIARWCEHGYGTLSIEQEGGSIIEVNGFKYPRQSQEKLIDDGR